MSIINDEAKIKQKEVIIFEKNLATSHIHKIIKTWVMVNHIKD